MNQKLSELQEDYVEKYCNYHIIKPLLIIFFDRWDTFQTMFQIYLSNKTTEQTVLGLTVWIIGTKYTEGSKKRIAEVKPANHKMKKRKEEPV